MASAPQTAYGIAPTGYRLPDATRLGPVRLEVADLVRSLDYYQTVLGFRLVRRSDRRASLAAEGDDRTIVELNERAGARPVPARGRLGLYHFAILLPDRASLGRFVTHLRALGAHAGSADHLVSEALYLTDPDGLGIEVYADRPRSTWQVDGRQLAMASDPLDMESLLRAAGGIPWTGMPTNTTIGHVHLSVGDLDQAEDFYHAGLGFDKVVWSYPGALFLSAGGYHHHIGTNTWAAGAPAAGDRDARLLEWTLLLPEPREAAVIAQRLAGAGHAVLEDGSEWVAVDPWGTRVRIVGGGAGTSR